MKKWRERPGIFSGIVLFLFVSLLIGVPSLLESRDRQTNPGYDPTAIHSASELSRIGIPNHDKITVDSSGNMVVPGTITASGGALGITITSEGVVFGTATNSVSFASNFIHSPSKFFLYANGLLLFPESFTINSSSSITLGTVMPSGSKFLGVRFD